MKVLGIIGSRRKNGNTSVLVKAALEALEAAGIDTRAVFLEDYQINGCLGCEACRENFKCVQQDGMQELYPLLTESDAIVIGSPTHFYNVAACVNAFFERCYCFEVFSDDDRSVWCSVNEALGGKYAIVIAVCEQNDEADMGFAAEAMSLPLQALGYRVVEQVKILGLFKKGDALHDDQAVRRANEAGRKLAKTLMLRRKIEVKLGIEN